MSRCTIVHVSDLHFGSPSSGFGIEGLRASFLYDLRRSLGEVERPIYFVISGDVCWTADTSEFDLAIQFILDLRNQISVPTSHVIIVPGNHDVSRKAAVDGNGLVLYDQFIRTLGVESDRAAPRLRIFGQQSVAFVRINTIDGNGVAGVDERELRNLRAELHSAPMDDLLLVAVLHHGLVDNASDGVSESAAADLTQLFDEWGVDLVLHGHAHGNEGLLARQTSVAMRFQLGAGSWRSVLATKAEWRYWLVEVEENGLTLRSRSFIGEEFSWADDRSTAVGVSRSLLTRRRPILMPAAQPLSAPSPQAVRALAERLSGMSPQDFEEILRRAGVPRHLLPSPEFVSRWELVHSLLSVAERSGSFALLEQESKRLGSEPGQTVSRVFISYSRSDRIVAQRLASELAELGYAVWFDAWEVNVGDRLSDKITHGMSTADAMLLLISPDYVRSPYADAELKLWASMREPRHILPIKIAECVIPASVSRYTVVDFSKETRIDTREIAAQLQRILMGTLTDNSDQKHFGPSSASSAELRISNKDHRREPSLLVDALFTSFRELDEQGYLPAPNYDALFTSDNSVLLGAPYLEVVPIAGRGEPLARTARRHDPSQFFDA
jgi:UDP-2,3-diacylglucosamine pyrophosphatase LpxH